MKQATAERFLLVLATALLLMSCSRARPTPEKVNGSAVEVPRFVVQVKLSPEASKRLTSIHESIKVLAMFDGDALPGQGSYNAPNRDVVLGSAEKLVGQDNSAVFNGVKIPLHDWKRLSDKNYYVTINTVSARLSDKNNLLDCTEPIDQRIETFRDKTIEVSCWLIGESDAPIE